MKFLTISVAVLLAVSQVFGQSVLIEKVLFPSGNKLKKINAGGIVPAVAGAGANNTYFLTPGIEFTNIAGNGFLYRNSYEFFKYNDNLEKEWDTEIKPAYSLQSLPYNVTLGDNNGIYFIQISDNPAAFNQLSVTKFNSKGQPQEVRFAVKGKYDGKIGEFVNKDGCHLIVYKNDKKDKTITYSLLSFSSTNLTTKEKIISLESTEDEYKMVDRWDYSGLWKLIAKTGNKLILGKSYFSNEKGSKSKNIVAHTAEVDFMGNVSNKKIFTLADPMLVDISNTVINGDQIFFQRTFTLPRINMDTLNNEIYVYGISEEEGSRNIHGFEIFKFNYATGRPIVRKEISFDEINKYLGDKSKINPKDFNKNSLYPFHDLIKSNFIVDERNQGLRISFYPNYKGMNTEKVTMIRTRLDKMGNLVQIDECFYKNHVNSFYGYDIVPETKTTVLKDPNSDYKLIPIDFIHSLSGKIDKEYTLFSTFYKKDFDIVVYIREKDGEMKAFKLSK
ncbi:MAG: hypothetical protein K2Q22_05620 [Cytophagales bacterium]|nr:hypothetical protein [Cytophagales bacterium]